jgi:hypothetical protein
LHCPSRRRPALRLKERPILPTVRSPLRPVNRPAPLPPSRPPLLPAVRLPTRPPSKLPTHPSTPAPAYPPKCLVIRPYSGPPAPRRYRTRESPLHLAPRLPTPPASGRPRRRRPPLGRKPRGQGCRPLQPTRQVRQPRLDLASRQWPVIPSHSSQGRPDGTPQAGRAQSRQPRPQAPDRPRQERPSLPGPGCP